MRLKIPTMRLKLTPTKTMPRFRGRAIKQTMTEVVHVVLARAVHGVTPFALFVIDGRAVLSSTRTNRYLSLAKRWPDALVGSYDKYIKVADLIDDLAEHFSDAEG